MVTLSTNAAAFGSQITGLLYVPDLAPSDPCVSASAPFLPQNVTRLSNLPDNNANLVALAPWLSAECTKSYLAAMAGSAQLLQGVVFFLGNNTSDPPPSANDAAWNLGDGGQWKNQNQFPVYAIPSASATMLLNLSALYSGNMSSVPFGANLTQIYDPHDYVRLFLEISTAGTGGLPSLWVFLLIIVAILLLIVASTSLTMHFLQRRRRALLRRRVVNGQVDLEALGIRRLIVPQGLLEKMPLYTYEVVGAARPTDDRIRHSAESSDSIMEQKPLSTSLGTPKLSEKQHQKRSQLDQPTCAICLDDFTPGETTVRELPCQHIFHPDCIDTFLTDNSSLCPLCKVSALPKGYCPTVITNAMVRRERHIRRVRAQAGLRRGVPRGVPNIELEDVPTVPHHRLLSRLRGHRAGIEDPEVGQPEHDTTAQAILPVDAETSETSHDPATLDQGPATAPPEAERRARREWARRRALAMLGPRPAPSTAAGASADGVSRSRWRKWLGQVFPTTG